MSNDRRTLGLKKTPAQKATERHEDALMQKIASESGIVPPPPDDEGGDPESAVASVPPGTPPADEVLMIDEAIPYAIVSGEPGVAYIQGKDFYDRAKRMVREAPMAQWYFAEPPSKKKSLMEMADEARGELKSKGLWHNVPGHDAPRKSLLTDIEKENARARAAEANAA